MASGSYVQSVQAAHSCNMGTNLGAPLVAVPKSSAHSAEEQEAWLPPVAVVDEVADIPTATVVACTQTGAGRGLTVAQTARDGTSMGCC